MVTNTPVDIFLSPPHMSGNEFTYLKEAFDSNWIAPVGPHLERFEESFCKMVGCPHAVAVSSGSAALHLATRLAGIGKGDLVLCSDLTFVASVAPFLQEHATPILIDCEQNCWNLDPHLVAEEVKSLMKHNKRPKAVVVVHLYGQSCDLDPIIEVCKQNDILLIEDAAESLGASYKGKHTGTFGESGIFSFNGNKIITTSGGGMFVSNNKDLVDQARFLATQAREPAPHYEHKQVGFNYRLSNLAAAIGIGQLESLPGKIKRRCEINQLYRKLLKIEGISFLTDPSYSSSTHWLSSVFIDETKFGASPEQIRQKLLKHRIEARPLWKPMHMQPALQHLRFVGSGNSEKMFRTGLCLPSGTAMTDEQVALVAGLVLECRDLGRAS